MEQDSEEFTPIIASGIEYSGVSTYRAPSPRVPHRLPSQKSRSGNGTSKAGPEDGRIPSTPRALMSQSKSLPHNYEMPEISALNPWRTSSRGIPKPPRNPGVPVPASAPRLSRSVSSGHGRVSAGASVKPEVLLAESRLSNGHSRPGEDDSSSTKSAPIRHLSFSRGSFKLVSVGIRRLRQLARQGSWKLLIERVKDAQRRGLLASPDQEIAYGTYHLLALMKLQDFHAAAQEIAAFGDLDAPQYRFENHPDLYPEKSGSMVPFALRCMHAELPYREGKTAETLHRLYGLLSHCDSEIDALQAEPNSHDATERNSATSEESTLADSDLAVLKGLLSTWRERREAVCFSIVGYHLHQQQFVVALKWLNKLMAKSPSDPQLKAKAALVQVQLGDISGAQRTFADVEALLSSSSDPGMENLLARNRGILYVALGEFSKAIAEFNAVLARDSHDIVSANNKALCLLHNQQMVAATGVLEDAIFRWPKSKLDEAVIGNVCSVYEVVSFSGAAAKRSLRTWVKEQGPDDFEPTSFRL